ncbi:MAG: hypothetical protein PUC50_03750 [Bacteroidales bacterium]|nr:hypothetical protein [Bacteroidales bacterium]
MKALPKIALMALAMTLATSAFAQEELEEQPTTAGLIGEEPVIVHSADRVLIYPQRMALDENTSVMDLLMMFPEALSRNFQNLDDRYVVRVENFNYEADQRLFLTTLKAKYVQKIQICDNPDVMKGSKGINGGVIDLNMVRGAMENDIFIGAEIDTKGLSNTPIANAVYGNGKTDVLVTASLADPSMKGEYGSTARCAAKVNQALNDNHNLMYDIAARYNHNNDNIFSSSNSRYYGSQIQYDGVFNEAGTALSVSGGWEYYDDGAQASLIELNTERTREVWQVYIVELWTPLFEGLELTAGWELDYANTSCNYLHKNFDKDIITSSDSRTYGFEYDYNLTTYNNDFYAQLDYTVGPLSLSLGDRVMCYRYKLGDEDINHPYNLIVASATLTPNWHHQIQGSYYRRFNSPDYIDIHNTVHYSDLGSTVTMGNKDLKYQPADVYRLMYTYSTKKFWASLIGRYIDTRDRVVETEGYYLNYPVTTFTNDPTSYSITNIDAAFTFALNKTLSFNIGGSYFNQDLTGENAEYYYARISPIVTLPGNFKINAQAIWCSDKSPEKLLTDTEVYTMLGVQKTFGKHLTIAAQWHDILCKDLSTGNFRVTYRF